MHTPCRYVTISCIVQYFMPVIGLSRDSSDVDIYKRGPQICNRDNLESGDFQERAVLKSDVAVLALLSLLFRQGLPSLPAIRAQAFSLPFLCRALLRIFGPV